MSEAMYEAIAYAMRYWFIFAMIVVLLAVIYVSVKEYKQRKFVMEEIGKYIGYIEVIGGKDDLIGKKFGIQVENTIGRSHKSDIVIDDDTLLKSHALLYKKDDDLYISSLGKGTTFINGRRATRAHMLKTGDILTLGNVRFRVFIKRLRVNYDY